MEYTTIDDALKIPMDTKMRGAILKKKREILGLSQSDVAKELANRLGLDNFDYKRLSAWENGKTKTIPEDIKFHLYSILELNEYTDLVHLQEKVANDVADIYTSLATEFKSYVTKQVNKHPDMLAQKEFDNDVALKLEGMLSRFLQGKYKF